ncbi:MAG: hypothetical protein ACP5QA_11485, partial [Phycisphaerae bacterium]
ASSDKLTRPAFPRALTMYVRLQFLALYPAFQIAAMLHGHFRVPLPVVRQTPAALEIYPHGVKIILLG